MPRVFLIDDDRRHSELLKSYLGRFGIELEYALDAESGLARLAASAPDLLLLDVMLPGRDGFELCREVRRTSDIPIVMLTARGDVIDRVSGLELGADDYVGKPFEPRELVARIQTILRRVGRSPVRQMLQFAGMEIDIAARSITVDGAPVELTSMEFELLHVLARNAGRKMSRDDLQLAIRGVDVATQTRSVDIAVSRLRHKIGDTGRPSRFIKTVRGRGYVFVGQAVSGNA